MSVPTSNSANAGSAKVHLPTGPIELEAVVALTIEELGAEPLREDWELLLNANRAR